MAARKSCTHLTWAEAKAKVGEGKGKGGKKTVTKNVSHGKILADKIIMKQQPSETDKIADRQAVRRARKDEERSRKLEERRRAEKEQQRLEAVVKPHEQSLERMEALSERIQKERQETGIDKTSYELNVLQTIAECKQSQLDEILALEAMYTDEEFRISEGSDLDILRNKIEGLDDINETDLRSIVRHTPISFTLQLKIDDDMGSNLTAHILMRVEFPVLYPLHDAIPNFRVCYFMVTDKTTVCNANKPLESLGFLEESDLVDAIDGEAEKLLPYPVVYEIASTWLPENLFCKFITMRKM